MKGTPFKKLVRFMLIYGPYRAIIKALGRLRIGVGLPIFSNSQLSRVAMIGCGQFAFSTLAYFLRKKANIVRCFDVDAKAAHSFGRLFRAKVVDSASMIMSDSDIDIVYIASNHASHTEYAKMALHAGKRVYVEKPVSVSWEQFISLSESVKKFGADNIFAGYNRPFSGAIRDLSKRLDSPRGPLTLSCFISGHVIGTDHWYRNPDEGTRICGNVGHWLDLAVHLLSKRGLPNSWKISLCWSNPQARDDDMAISLTSEKGDLVTIILTARTEPFEGINETINLQWDEFIAKIDDFRSMTVWEADKIRRYRYWPKDVGHKRAVRQPFSSQRRAWREIEDSTLLMLHITDMVKAGKSVADFSFNDVRSRLTP